MASPECSIAVGYVAKWYFFQALPIGLGLLGVAANGLVVVYKYIRFPKRRREQGYLTKHSSGIYGFILLMLNFLYISLTKQGFEALDCTMVGFEHVLVADATVSCSTKSYAELKLWGECF